MLLARRGYRVLLVDRATFPSDTISSHLVHSPGMAALERWGLADAVRGTGCPPIDTYRFDFGPFAIVGRPQLVEDGSVAHAPRRTVLDAILVEAAARAGVEVRESFGVQELIVEDGVVRGITGRGSGRAVQERARIVIGADGATSAVARFVRAAAYEEVPAQEALYLAYWSGVSTGGEFQIYAREDRALAAIPTNDGLTVVLAVWPIEEFAANRRDLLGNYLAAFAVEPTFAERLRDATRETRVVGKAMAGFYRQSHGPGWALVGDAGYHKDAVTAQGITDAFLDAEALAAAIDDGFAGRRSLDEALAARQAARDERTGPMYGLTAQLASFEPAPAEQVEHLAALAADPSASDAFMSVFAGTLPVEAVFGAPEVSAA
jgi:2-polyprenyl-6-methoxyphenol hydroxylase-like FAD-dependent oxidoreductase